MRALPCMVLFFTTCLAAQPQVAVSVDRSVVEVGDEFRITVEATGDQVGEPKIPSVPGIEIDTAPIYSDSDINATIVNGVLSATGTRKVRGYRAQALAVGEIEIPPIGVPVGDGIMYGNAVRIQVVRTRKGDLSWDDVLQLTVEPDSTEVFEGESITVAYTLWAVYGSQVRQFESDFSSTTGFYAIPRDPQQLDDGVAGTRNGQSYTAVHWRQILFPTKVGELEIGPWVWKGRIVKPFGRQMRSVSYETDPVIITVKPLPPPPPKFSGSVGQYSLTVRRSREDALQGTPVKITVHVAGRGNPDAVQAPRMPAVDWAYIADPELKPLNASAVASDKVDRTYVYTITPIQAGTHTLPAVEFCYFDPELGEYVTAGSDALEWQIRPSGEVQPQPVADNADVAVLSQDILPIRVDVGPISRRSSAVLGVFGVTALPALTYAGLALFVRRQRRFESDPRYARAYHAFRRAHKRLAGVRQSSVPAETLYKAVAGYLADTFDSPEGGLTSADAERLLREQGIDEELSGGIVKILKRCERASYGAGKLSDDEVNALAHGAMLAMERFDALHKKGGRP